MHWLLAPAAVLVAFKGLGAGWVLLTRINKKFKRNNGITSSKAISSQSAEEYKPRGLRNMGNTCYMNSVLQALYHTDDVRDQIINLDSVEDSLANSLQEIFQNLEDTDRNGKPVATDSLVRACGVNPNLQEDAQEFFLNIIDKLDAVTGEPVSRHFEGRTEQINECLQVNFTKSKSQRFYDLSLDIAGINHIEDALLDYFDDELLTGDEKIKAGEYGRQEALRRTLLKSAPENLILTLKRFAYDVETDSMLKLHDRVEFPTLLNLTALHLNASAEEIVYDVYGVILHDGNPNYGHYTYLCRSLRHPQTWFHINDHFVSEVDSEFVEKKAFGGETYRILGSSNAGSCNAYLLLYKKRKIG